MKIHPRISYDVDLCPICGGNPEIYDDGYGIQCSSCGASFSIFAPDISKEDAARGVNFVRVAMLWNEWAHKEKMLKDALEAGETK